ncbi:MAG: type VI secretion system ATPase TssH, partial [Pseudomonadota bacterium]
MSGISRESLFQKLNPTVYKSVESAYTYTKMRGNPFVELVHVVHQLLQMEGSDLQHLARHEDLDASALARDITAALDKLPRASSSYVDLSDQLMSALERGWAYGSLSYGAPRIRSGHIIVGI